MLRNYLGKIAAGAAVAAVLACPTAVKGEFTAGYNAIENGVTSSQGWRIRLMNNVSYRTGKVEIDYQGLNETNWDDYSFGSHRLLIGKKGSRQKAVMHTMTDYNGWAGTKYGVSDTSVCQRLGGDGYIDFTAGRDSMRFIVFYCRDLGHGWSAYLNPRTDFLNGEKPFTFTELQVNRKVSDSASVFARAENSNGEKTAYLIGVEMKL